MAEEQRSIDDTDLMDMKQVADYLGVKYYTFTAHVSRKDAPEPDLKIRRTKLWKKATIDAWNESRPSTIRKRKNQ